MFTEQHQVPAHALLMLPTGEANFPWSQETNFDVPVEYLSGGCPVSFGWDGGENGSPTAVRLVVSEGLTYLLL